MDISAYVTGSTQPKLSQTSLLNMKVELPEIDKQDAIAAFLHCFDAKIAANVKLNGYLEELARVIVQRLFPGYHGGNDSVGNYVEPKRGRTLLSKNAIPGEVPVVAGGLKPATLHNESNTLPPVLTISSSGANAGYVGLWGIPVWSSDSSFIDSSISEDVYFWYTVLSMRQNEIYDAQTGSAQPHIYPQQIKELPIAPIDDKLIKRLNEKIAPLYETISANKIENKKLADLRDALLPKLMSGEIDVSKINLTQLNSHLA